MSIEPETKFFAQGWMLQDAIERTADPQDWDAWITAHSNYEKAGGSKLSSLNSFITPSPYETKLRQIASEAWNKVEQRFRQFLLSGSLVASGSRNEQSVPPSIIHSEGWRTLRRVNLEKSIMREPAPTRTRIYNVRVFPLVHADDAAARLSGLSIVQAFRRCVIEDPEVVAASKRIADYERHRHVFEEGQFPRPMSYFQWPLDLPPDELAAAFIRPAILILGGGPVYEPPPDPAIRRTASILTDRWSRLRQRLIDGELLARGTYVQSGEVRPIDQYQWARKGLVDVSNGDLLEFVDRKPVVRWSGLSLVRPVPATSAHMFADGRAMNQQSMSPGSADPPLTSTEKGQSPARRRRPRADAVAEALKAHGLDSDAQGKSWKVVASIIALDMVPPVRNETEMLALTKAVERYYKRLREGRSD